MADPLIKIVIPTTRYITVIVGEEYWVIDPVTGKIVRKGKIPPRISENVNVLARVTDALTATKSLAEFADVDAGLAKVAIKSVKAVETEIEKAT